MLDRPFQRILVPLDGSRLAEAILPVAAGLARACDARLVLLHVLEREPPEAVHGEPHVQTSDEASDYLASLALALDKYGAATQLRVVTADESGVAAAIARVASEEDTDLIAMTTHGSGGIRGLLFGRIAQQVLQRAERPTLVLHAQRPARGHASLPASLSPVQFRRILVPLSGEPSSTAVVELVWTLARCTGAEIVLARVVPVVDSLSVRESPQSVFLPRAAAALLEIEEDEARRELESLAAKAPPGISLTVVVQRGETIAQLTELARHADLTVIVTHGRAGIEGWLSGSTASRLLARVSTPLLLVPAGRVEATS